MFIGKGGGMVMQRIRQREPDPSRGIGANGSGLPKVEAFVLLHEQDRGIGAVQDLLTGTPPDHAITIHQ